MHAYTYSGHPTCCAVALKNLDINGRGSARMRRRWSTGCTPGSSRRSATTRTPETSRWQGAAGGGRVCRRPAGEGELRRRADGHTASPSGDEAAWRYHADGPAAGAHPAQGDAVLLAPPLVVTEKEVDRLVSVLRGRRRHSSASRGKRQETGPRRRL
jgi:putrescine---pyruvate transaminase